MKRYCLASYILTAEIPNDIGFGIQSVSIGGNIGGEGSYLNSVTIHMEKEMFTTQADDTGSWVHVKSLNRSGTIEVSIKQVSDKIAIFKALVNAYANLNFEADGMTLTLRDALGNTICVANDCLLQKIPDQAFASEPDNQSWTFTCGQIIFTDTKRV